MARKQSDINRLTASKRRSTLVPGAFLISLSLTLADSTYAQTVGSLPFNYSGRITEASGAPKDGPIEIVATFWTSDIDGTQLGSLFDFPAVNLAQGLFSLTFPFTAPQVQDIFRDGSEAVYIQIASGDEKYPRQRFTFIPLAMRVPVDNKTLSFDTTTGQLGIKGVATASAGTVLTRDTTGGVRWATLNADSLVAKNQANGAASNDQVLTYKSGKWVAASLPPAAASGNYLTALTGDVTATGPGSVTATLAPVALPGTATKVTFDAKGRITAGTSLNASDITAALGFSPLTAVNITAGTGLAGGPITTSGTLSLADTTVTAGTYTRTTVTVDAQGRITAAANGAAITNADIADNAAIAQSKISGLDSSLAAKQPTITSGTTSDYFRGDKTWQQLTTAVVGESGTSLYYSDVRARGALSGTGPITYSLGSGAIGISQATNSTNGFLSSTDWTTFNTKQNALGYSPLNKAGDTMSGALDMGTQKITDLAAPTSANDAASKTYVDTLANGTIKKDGSVALTGPWAVGSDLTNVGNISMATAKTLGLGIFDNPTETTMIATLNASGSGGQYKGKTWFNTSTNEVKYWDGSVAKALGVSGAGLTNLNGVTSSSQTFATGSSGNAPAIGSAGSTHTLNIPLASAGPSVTAGLLSNADYAAFNGKVSSVAQGTGITVATASGTATVALANTTVTAGTYARANIIVDQQGRLTAAASGANVNLANEVTGVLPTANGGTGVNSAATFPAAGVVVTRDAAETLSNKTLTAPFVGTLINTGTLSLPTTTDTLVGRNTTDTLTSKTLLSATINGASSISGTTTINTTGTATTGALTASTVTSQGNVTILGNGTTNANKLLLNDKTNTNYIALKAPDNLNAQLTWELPATNGTAGQVLATNGSGTLSWAAGAAPSGAASGDLTGSYPAPTLAAVGTAGTYVKVTTDSKGRVSSGTTLVPGDIPTLPAAIIGGIGALGVANGGTGSTNLTLNGVLLGNNTGNVITTAAGAAYQSFTVPIGGGVPSFSAVNLSQAAAVTGTLAVGNGGTGGTTAAAARTALGAAASGANSDITSITGLTTKLAVSQGGTGLATIPANGMIYGNGTGNVQTTGAGSPYQVLQAGASSVPTFGALNLAQSAAVTGALPVANGGTGLSAVPTNGQIAIGNGTNYSLATLTAGSGISITNGSGSINIAVNSNNFVATTGSTMTGKLTLPVDGLVAGTNQLVLANGNVGIGTMSPLYKLDVAGTVRATSFITTGNTDWNAKSLYNLLNLGIGTTTPAGSLSFGGTVARTLQVDRNTTPATGGNNLNVSGGGATINSTDQAGGSLILASGISTGAGDSSIQFQTATANASGTVDNTPATKMSILGNGNVGIGTSSPSSLLEVNGTIKSKVGGFQFPDGTILTTAPGSGTVTNQTSTTNINFASDTANTANSSYNISFSTRGLQRMVVANSGAVGIGTASPLSALDVRGGVAVGSYAGTNAAPTDGLIVSGNLGIGTTAPNAKIHVKGVSGTDGIMYPDGTLQTSASKWTPLAGYGVYYDNGSAGPGAAGNYGSGLPSHGILLNGYQSEGWNRYADIVAAGGDMTSAMRFYTKRSDGTYGVRMQIASNGNIGIGTISPTNPLEVNGVIRSLTGGFKFPDGTIQTTSATGTNGTSSQWSASGSDIFYNGKIGIGTSVPTQPLTVAGVIQSLSGGIMFPDGTLMTSAATTLSGVSSTTDLNLASDSGALGTGQIIMATFGAERLRVANNGNVGIGSTSPKQKLDVAGIIRSSTGGIMFPDGTVMTSAASGTSTGSTSDSALAFASDSGNTSNPAYNISFATNSAQRLSIANNGNIILGGGEGSTPTSAMLRGAAASGTNTLGAPFTIAASTGTGTGGSGALNFQTASAGSSGTTSNTLATRMTISPAGNVGIGTTSPAYSLSIGGGGGFGVDNSSTFAAKNSSGTYENYLWPRWSDNVMYLNYGSSGFNIRNNSSTSSMFINNGGNVGIGTTSPGSKLQVNGNGSIGYATATAGPLNGLAVAGNIGIGTNIALSKLDVAGGVAIGSYAGAYEAPGNGLIVSGLVGIGNNAPVNMLDVAGDADIMGNLGIGTTAPSNTLQVIGSLCVNAVGGACAGSTAGTIYATNTTVSSADLAEHVTTDDETLIPGDILVTASVKSSAQAEFVKSSHAKQKNAIGVVSTKPGVTLGADTPSSRPVALAGRVPVNVTVEGGVIVVGDYLVSSSTPGKAMRAASAADTGIIGVALSNYDGTSIPSKEWSDGIAHEVGHQVMMLVHLGAGSQLAVAQLKARADKAEAESAQLKAALCKKFPELSICLY